MQKFIILIFIILPFCLNGQFSSAKYYFEKCKDKNKIQEEKCTNAEMSKWIYDNIIKKIPQTDLKDKKKLALSIKIDTLGIINNCVLSWKENNRYFIKDIPVKNNKIVGFITESLLNATYTFNETLTPDESLVYIRDNEIFKIVEIMPSLDSCLFTADMKVNDCAKSALFSAIKKNIVYSKEAKENNVSGKIPFGLVIDLDGCLGDVNIYKQTLGNGAEEALVRAIQELKKQKFRVLPGFQRSMPVNVLLTLQYPFDISK
ncbi:MAG: hypothetical protein WAT37_09810 [Saprospiraceae bacterium]